MYDICCGYIWNKEQSEELKEYGGCFLETGKSVSAGGGWIELCLLFLSEKHAWRTESYSKNPQKPFICTETKVDMLVVGKKNTSILQNLAKNDGEMLCDTF